ncbi:MAG: hypothetical protein E6J90_41570 [Deltaproteobacteria bacterium]|nr:MAG: hypothetical protein E6J90_41570 [Deltaproteobacteria bacterium]
MIYVQRSFVYGPYTQVLFDTPNCADDVLFLLGDSGIDISPSEFSARDGADLRIRLTIALPGADIDPAEPAAKIAAMANNPSYDVVIWPVFAPFDIMGFDPVTQSWQYWDTVGAQNVSNTSPAQTFPPASLVPASTFSRDLFGDNVFWVVYDTNVRTNDAGQTKYRTRGFDAAGNATKVCITATTTLYHEFAHIMSLILGWSDASDPTGERHAREEENLYRTLGKVARRDPDRTVAVELGQADLCILQPSMPPPAPPPSQSPDRGGSCLIATAACDGEASAEVIDLRRIRDALLRGTAVGLDFFDHLFWEYYAFSPAVVRAMGTDRSSVRDHVVRPYLQTLLLIERSCRGEDTDGALRNWLEDSDPSIALKLEAVVRQRKLATVEISAHLPCVEWAVLDPLRLAAELVRRANDGPGAARWFRTNVAKWAVNMPITNFWAEASPERITEAERALRAHLLEDDTQLEQFRLRVRAGRTVPLFAERRRGELSILRATCARRRRVEHLEVTLLNTSERDCYVVDCWRADPLVAAHVLLGLHPQDEGSLQSLQFVAVPAGAQVRMRGECPPATARSAMPISLRVNWLDAPWYPDPREGCSQAARIQACIAGQAATLLRYD